MLSATHQFGLVYNSPTCRDHARRLKIGVSIAAGCAAKYIAQAFAAGAAVGAGLAGIPRVDVFNPDPDPCGFIGHEVLQLAKAPTAHHAVEMAAPDARALTDMPKLFQTDGSVTVPYGFVNDALAQDVVFVPYAAGLIAGQPFQAAPGGSGAFALQRGADTVARALEFLSFSAGMQSTAAGGGSVADTKVNPHRRPFNRSPRLILDYQMNFPFAALAHQRCRSWIFAAQRFQLIGPKLKWNMQTTGGGSERNRFVTCPVGEDAGIVIDAGGFESAGLTTVAPGAGKGGRCATNGSHREVSRKTEALAQFWVTELMQPQVVSFTIGQCGVAGRSKGDAGICQCLRRDRIRQQLTTNRPHGDDSITTKEDGAIPLPLKSGSLLAPSL